jgi:hypothetical protein
MKNAANLNRLSSAENVAKFPNPPQEWQQSR